MITPELSQYIKQAQALGKSADTIRQELVSQGWGSDDINNALNSEVGSAGPVQSVSKTPIKIPRWAIVALVVVGLGVIGYFTYAHFRSPSSQTGLSAGNSLVQGEKFSSCSDILSDSDFERVTGQKASSYVKVFYPTHGGGNTVVYCVYSTQEQYQANLKTAESVSSVAGDVNSQSILKSLKIDVTSNGTSVTSLATDSNINTSMMELTNGKSDYAFTITYQDTLSDMTSWFNTSMAQFGGSTKADFSATDKNGNQANANIQNNNGEVTVGSGGQSVGLGKFTVTDLTGVANSAKYVDLVGSQATAIGGRALEDKNIYALSSNRQFIIKLGDIDKYDYVQTSTKNVSGYNMPVFSWVRNAASLDLDKAKELTNAIDSKIGK